jgi:hypothetical protein
MNMASLTGRRMRRKNRPARAISMTYGSFQGESLLPRNVRCPLQYSSIRLRPARPATP